MMVFSKGSRKVSEDVVVVWSLFLLDTSEHLGGIIYVSSVLRSVVFFYGVLESLKALVSDEQYKAASTTLRNN